MADRVKGITIQIGGDTAGLSKALSGVNRDLRATQSQLKDVERLLKLDPTNTELLAQKQRLLGQSVQQTKEKLAALREADRQAQEQLRSGKLGSEQYDALRREVVATTAELNRQESQLKSSHTALQQLGAACESIGGKARQLARATAAVSAASAGLLTAAVTSAAGFEDSFAKLSTLLDESVTDVDDYRQRLLAASDETGVAAADMAEGVYSAISASVDSADAIAFTVDAIRLAKGGFTDTAKAVDVLTTAINGYGLSASEAGAIGDLLITTQNLGKTTVDELAASMGKVIPVASAAGFGLEELSTGYAVLTQNGIATAEAGTYLKAMLNELTKAGGVTDKTLRELTGQGFAALKAEGRSTTEILGLLSESAQADGKTLKDLFGSVEGGSAAMVLARGAGEEYDAVLQQMTASAGATDKAFGKVTGTASQKLKKGLNELKNAGIELGAQLLPLVEKAAAAVQQLAGWLSGLDGTGQTVLVGLAAFIAVLAPAAQAVGVLTQAAGVLNAVLMANPIGLIIGLLAALGAALLLCSDDNESFLADLRQIWSGVQQVLGGVLTFLQGVFTGDWQAVWDGLAEIVKGAVTAVTGLLRTLGESLQAGINKLLEWLGLADKVSVGPSEYAAAMQARAAQARGQAHTVGKAPVTQLPMMAKGGTLLRGSAIVGEAGPELLTVNAGYTTVTPLSGDRPQPGTTVQLQASFYGYTHAQGAAVVRDLNRQLGRLYGV